MLSEGAPDLSRLAADVLSRLSCLGVVAGAPSLPFASYLLRRADAGAESVVPLDTETRTFLSRHSDRPAGGARGDPARTIAALLSNRKGVIAEGVGIVASGPVTLRAGVHPLLQRLPRRLRQVPAGRAAGGFRPAGGSGGVPLLRETFLRPLRRRGFASAPPPRRSGRGPCGDPRRRSVHRPAGAGRLLSSKHLLPGRRDDLHLPDRGVPRRTRRLHRSGPDGQPLHDRDHLLQRTARHRRIYEATGARAILHGHRSSPSP